MIQYFSTNCCFTRTDYYGRLLYALHTILINGSDQLNFVIRLGEKWEYVKHLARNLDKNSCMLHPLYLKEEIYKSDTPFFIRLNNSLQRDNSGGLSLYFSCNLNCPMYYDGHQYSYLKYNDVNSRFEYEVRRGNFILAEKECNEWHLPRNIDEILLMPPKYKTDIISMSELLK